MPSKVLIGNLPSGTAADEVVALFGDTKTSVEVLKMVDDGDPDRVTATVALGVDQSTAKIMADRAKTRHFKGRELTFYVPQFFS